MSSTRHFRINSPRWFSALFILCGSFEELDLQKAYFSNAASVNEILNKKKSRKGSSVISYKDRDPVFISHFVDSLALGVVQSHWFLNIDRFLSLYCFNGIFCMALRRCSNIYCINLFIINKI